MSLKANAMKTVINWRAKQRGGEIAFVERHDGSQLLTQTFRARADGRPADLVMIANWFWCHLASGGHGVFGSACG